MYKSATPVKIHRDMQLGTKKIYHCFLLFSFLSFHQHCLSQDSVPVFAKDTKTVNRDRLYKSLVNNAITKNLSLPLTDSTEENWMDAFNAIELIKYKSPLTVSRIYEAFNNIEKRSDEFQRSLLSMIYDNYPSAFSKEVARLLNPAVSSKVFAMSAEYLAANQPAMIGEIKQRAKQQLLKDSTGAIIQSLISRLDNTSIKKTIPSIRELMRQAFFKNAVLVFSFQRKDRNYPGLVIVRDTAGDFIKNSYGNIFSVQQLARSITNLPSYISNGNTPQGIFRMDGFAVSRSNFIGPTPNIQLTMPVETSIRHFMKDSSILDTLWTEDWYRKLLPAGWKNYTPFFESYYAGKAGRTEIIAHGTTINPAYYKGEAFYPLTPTLGCLCTTELWSGEDGKRMLSDQQQLVSAVQKAGGANGYYIVIELNDEQRPVTMEDIQPYLK